MVLIGECVRELEAILGAGVRSRVSAGVYK